MSLFSSLGQLASSSIGSAISGAASAGIGSVVAAAQAGMAAAGQIFSDANPSVTQKKVEALGQLGASGQLPSFKNVSDVKIETGYGEDQTNTPSGFGQVRLDPFGNPIVRVQSLARTMPVLGETEADESKTRDVMVTLRALTNFPADEATTDTDMGGVDVLPTVTFFVSPTISESRSADYDPVSLLLHPGQVLKYKSSSNRSWTISGKFISRSSGEAQLNLDSLNRLRAWVMPFTGEGTATNSKTKTWLGAPPPIIILSAYGKRKVGPVPVVIKRYSWEFPNEVDYIQTSRDKVPFPTVISVTVEVEEAYSPAEYSGFDWIKYREGNLDGSAFKSVPAEQVRKNKAASALPTGNETVAREMMGELQTVSSLIENSVKGVATSSGTVFNDFVSGSVASATSSATSFLKKSFWG